MITWIIVALAILCIDSFLTMFWCDKLGKSIKNLEDDINFSHQRIDAIVSDITNMKKYFGNIHNNIDKDLSYIYDALNEMKQKQN